MTRALFVTTASNEMYVVVGAWRSCMGPLGHITFNITSPPNDDAILACARGYEPDIIIYSGGNVGEGLPSVETLRALRQVAPSVHYQGDLEDDSWRPTLELYREKECFDLCVAQTGVHAPLTDYATLTAIDPAPFHRPPVTRVYRCGFPGNFQDRERFDLLKKRHGTEDPRSRVLHRLGNLVTLRQRETSGPYAAYVEFLFTTKLLLNTSFTGSGLKHHVKGRVVEGALAGCALLEMSESPTSEWFPEGSFFTYKSVEEAIQIIRDTPPSEVERRAAIFSAYAREHYSPQKIYGEMLSRLGIA